MLRKQSISLHFCCPSQVELEEELPLRKPFPVVKKENETVLLSTILFLN